MVNPKSPDALVRHSAEHLAGQVIRTPQALAARIREMQQVAHVLSPAIAVSSIAPHYEVNTAVVVIDTTLPKVEYGSAAGSDIYFQSSIHKSAKRDEAVIPEEVSLSKTGLLKILAAAGVDITRSVQTDDGRQQYLWRWASEGEIVDFDGRRRRLPPGNVEIDYRDGSAQIGSWTPEEWAARVAAVEDRKKSVPDRDRWKVKPEPINGWSEDRVRNARRFGLRIAEAESLNRLIRNLGVKQKYTLAELQKPFVIFRCSFVPDMTDPAVRQIVTAAHMGSARLLYGASPEPDRAPQAAEFIDVPSAAAKPPAPPAGAVEFDDLPEPEPPAPPPAVTYLITRATLLEIDGSPHYFFETREGPTFVTEDLQAARTLNAARKAGRPIPLEGERVIINGEAYLHVLECPPAPSQPLPDPRKL